MAQLVRAFDWNSEGLTGLVLFISDIYSANNIFFNEHAGPYLENPQLSHNLSQHQEQGANFIIVYLVYSNQSAFGIRGI